MGAFLKTPTGRIALSFVKAFVGAIVVAFTAGEVTDVASAKKVVFAALVGAADAVLKGVQVVAEKKAAA
jgi:hypothetical protein